MTEIEWFKGPISGDDGSTIELEIRGRSNAIVFGVGGEDLPLSLDQAQKLLWAAVRVERALISDKEPKEPVCVFQHTPFELWLGINPLGICLVWGAKQVTISAARASSLMFAFSRLRDAVDTASARPSSRPPPQPPPGRRWETWTPKCWRDVGGPGW